MKAPSTRHQPAKKTVRVPPRASGRCPMCSGIVSLEKMQSHIVTCRGKRA